MEEGNKKEFKSRFGPFAFVGPPPIGREMVGKMRAEYTGIHTQQQNCHRCEAGAICLLSHG